MEDLEIPPTSPRERVVGAQVSGHTILQLAVGEWNVLCQRLGVSEGSVVHRICSVWLPPESLAKGGRSAVGACTGHPLPQSAPIPHGGTSYLGSAAVRVSKVREGHGGCPWTASFFSCEFPPQPRNSAPPAARRLGSLRGCGCPAPAPPPAWHDWRQSRGQSGCEPCAPEGAPPARVVRKTEGPMDGQGKGEDMGCPRRAVAREGEARRGAVRLPRCPSPRWPEAQCDVTVIPGRQAGPRALGPRATKRAKRSQPVRARALSPTLTLVPGGLCSW